MKEQEEKIKKEKEAKAKTDDGKPKKLTE